MSAAPCAVYEPANGLAMVQWIECEAKAIAEIKKLEKSWEKKKNQSKKKCEILRGKREWWNEVMSEID